MVWINLFLFALVSAGYAALVIAAVNRIHGYPVSYRMLHWIRQGHDLVLVGIPLALVWFLGIQGPQLLRGGSWSQVSGLATAVVGGGLSGLLIPLCSGIARALRRPPNAMVRSQSRIIDVAAELGYRPVGKGPYQSMIRIPFNQIFELEVAEKEFRLERLPAAWKGLKIVHLSDFHFIGTVDRAYFEYAIDRARELKGDIVVFTGDLLDRQSLIEWLPATLGRIEAPLGKYFILGNHDWYLDPAEMRAAMKELGWQDVAGRTVVIEREGSPLVIAGTEMPWMGTHPSFEGTPEHAFRLLLSHTPDNIGWARQQRVDLMLSGHNHGGQVKLPLIGPVYSPSKYGCRYAEGLFWQPPTLMYVSRGLAGKHPWRWASRPEIGVIRL